MQGHERKAVPITLECNGVKKVVPWRGKSLHELKRRYINAFDDYSVRSRFLPSDVPVFMLKDETFNIFYEGFARADIVQKSHILVRSDYLVEIGALGERTSTARLCRSQMLDPTEGDPQPSTSDNGSTSDESNSCNGPAGPAEKRAGSAAPNRTTSKFVSFARQLSTFGGAQPVAESAPCSQTNLRSVAEGSRSPSCLCSPAAGVDAIAAATSYDACSQSSGATWKCDEPSSRVITSACELRSASTNEGGLDHCLRSTQAATLGPQTTTRLSPAASSRMHATPDHAPQNSTGPSGDTCSPEHARARVSGSGADAGNHPQHARHARAAWDLEGDAERACAHGTRLKLDRRDVARSQRSRQVARVAAALGEGEEAPAPPDVASRRDGAVFTAQGPTSVLPADAAPALHNAGSVRHSEVAVTPHAVPGGLHSARESHEGAADASGEGSRRSSRQDTSRELLARESSALQLPSAWPIAPVHSESQRDHDDACGAKPNKFSEIGMAEGLPGLAAPSPSPSPSPVQVLEGHRLRRSRSASDASRHSGGGDAVGVGADAADLAVEGLPTAAAWDDVAGGSRVIKPMYVSSMRLGDAGVPFQHTHSTDLRERNTIAAQFGVTSSLPRMEQLPPGVDGDAETRPASPTSAGVASAPGTPGPPGSPAGAPQDESSARSGSSPWQKVAFAVERAMQPPFQRLGGRRISGQSLMVSIVLRAQQAADNSEEPAPPETVRAAIWLALQDPGSGPWAAAWSIFISVIIVLANILFVLDTMPGIYDPERSRTHYLYILEIATTMIFTIELALHLVSAPTPRALASVWFAIDLVVLLPSYVEFATTGSKDASALNVLRIFRLLRVLRLFRVSRSSTRLLLLSVQRSAQMLGIMILLLVIGVIFIASVMHVIERGEWEPVLREWRRPVLWSCLYDVRAEAGGVVDQAQVFGEYLVEPCEIVDVPGLDHVVVSCKVPIETGRSCKSVAWETSPFDSIPASMWWALVTLCSVGYGDAVPITFAGRLIGCCVMLCGLVIIAMPITVIGNNFSTVYAEEVESGAYSGGATNVLRRFSRASASPSRRGSAQQPTARRTSSRRTSGRRQQQQQPAATAAAMSGKAAAEPGMARKATKQVVPAPKSNTIVPE